MLIPTHVFKSRNVVIDLFRAMAILLVVLYHFDHWLEIGFIGVDLFFVLSGYLVSKFYLNSVVKKEKIDWSVFLVKRFFKILPSYYFFLIAGTVFAHLVLMPDHSSQVIPLSDFPKYFFFYLNYSPTFHWSFELAWSLCVEEHFYLFLTGLFLIITYWFRDRFTVLKWLFIGFILLSLGFKIMGYYNGWDTYAATHMRMDALFLGVLLAYQETVEQKVKGTSVSYQLLGTLILILTVTCFYLLSSEFFSKVLLHTFIPLGFYFLIRGSLHLTIPTNPFVRTLRIMAYYSYNWYLWHALVAYTILNLTQFNKPLQFVLYLIISFILAVLTTKFVEEQFMKLRQKFIELIRSRRAVLSEQKTG